MSLVLARGRARPAFHVGLVNNMPDAALARTERQFAQLFQSAAPDGGVRFTFFSLAGIERSSPGRLHLKENSYRSTSELSGSGLDAVIVTGTEPKRPSLEDEPYWPAFTQIFDWLDRDGPPAMFSCLAAHAAVQHFDGIRRQPLSEKCFGVFSHVKASRSRLTEVLAPELYVAHSRWNEISASALTDCGYRILTLAPDAGVDLFVRERRNTWLFFQGHPEYDPTTLGREYQRDVRRFLTGERATFPPLPKNYFGSAERALLEEFAARSARERSETIMERFPVEICRRAAESWQSPAVSIISAWLNQIANDRACGRAVQFSRSDRIEPSISVSQS
jgi:homoserine O-succinyltransferase